MSFLPVSGSWSAVYANEGEDCSLRTEPVIMWMHTQERGGAMVGIIALGPSIVPATAPDLLGYARDGENISAKFAEALKAFKKEEATGAVAKLAAQLRSGEITVGPFRSSHHDAQHAHAPVFTPGRITELAKEAASAADICECSAYRTNCAPCADGNHGFCMTLCMVMPAIDMCQRFNKKKN
jgi:hypothetical protein